MPANPILRGEPCVYRLAICDDDPLYLEGNCAMAASVLQEAGIAHEIETFSWPEALLSRLRMEPGCFDMLILDILLGADNGVALARSLRDAGYQGGIVFVTNAREFSLEGYSVFPTHYLLKPLQREALWGALQRDYAARRELPSISVPIKGGVATVPFSGILYVESQLGSTTFHLKNRSITSSMRLHRARALLPSGAFVQCHKSFLVPIRQIQDITRARITLRSGQTLPVGRVYYDKTISLLAEYLQD